MTHYPSLQELGSDVTASEVGLKAHGLALAARLGLRVPDGFVIPAGARIEPAALQEAVAALSEVTGCTFGDPRAPMIVSIRSSGPVSRPGQLDTVLCFGATMDALPSLTGRLGSKGAALAAVFQVRGDAARVCGERSPSQRPPSDSEVTQALDAGVDVEATLPKLAELAEKIRARSSEPLAVIVQTMVFGSCSGVSGGLVAHSRHPVTGDPGPRGEWVPGELGDQLTRGRGNPRPLARSERPRDQDQSLEARAAGAFAEVGRTMSQLERAFARPVEAELTLENGALHLLQVRPAVLGPAGWVAATVALVEQGVISRREAFARVDLAALRRSGTSELPDEATLKAAGISELGRGLAASPGVASGRLALGTDEALREAERGPTVLVRIDASPEDAPAVRVAAAVATLSGGLTSHAAVMSRALGRPCVVSVSNLRIDEQTRSLRAGDRSVQVGDWVTVDGGTGALLAGRGVARWSTRSPAAMQLLSWAREAAGSSEQEPGEWYEQMRQVNR